MKSLFRSLEIRRREEIIKETLTSQLMNSVKEVQIEKQLHNDIYITSVDASNSLCTVLEAILIHGIKETLIDRMTSIIGDPDQRRVPQFWSLAMIFTHRDIIKQIHQMSQITTDVGRCRTWIRIALNDGLFISYLEAIIQENKALVPYYKKTAYLRDIDTLTVAVNVLRGIVQFKFSLPTNSKFLNIWSNKPLILAGIWTPPIKDCPIPSGMDIVKSIPDEIPEPVQIPPPISNFATNFIDEEEALRIILNTPIEGSPMQSQLDLSGRLDSSLNTSQDNLTRRDEQSIPKVDQLHSLSDRITTLSEQRDQEICEQIKNIPDDNTQLPVEENEGDNMKPSTSQHATMESYHKVLDSYNPSSSPPLQEPNLQEFIQSYEPSLPVATKKIKTETGVDEEEEYRLEYEVIESTSLTLNIPEFKSMIDQLAKVMQEKGLDSQGFSCKECHQHIGISFAKAKICSLTGVYYCTECFKSTDWVIPARIIHNWDFAKYPVSNKSSTFLVEVQDYPLFDIRKLNPRLYFAIEEMAELQKLRMKLNLLRLYLFTCHEPIRRELQKLVWPREYLYEHVHLYSIADLLDIPTGVLGELMKKAISLSVQHVKACQLCFQKGYICEICPNKETIYPFDIESTYRCSGCRSVFHNECKEKSKHCPKCYRIKKRRELQEAEDS